MARLEISSSEATLQSLFGIGKQYRVPRYQRDYSWDREQWDELWEDIQNLVQGVERYHYMGYLVLMEPSDRLSNEPETIVDGQQRLTTFSLIWLAAIQRLTDMGGEEERIEEIRRDYIGKKRIDSLVVESKLHLNRNNDFDYKKAVRGDQLPKTGKKTVALMRGAIEFFHSEFKKINNAKEIANLLDTISRQMLFTVLYIGTELNAYKVFETLNARGVHLSSGDLLKNYLFAVIDDAGNMPSYELDTLDQHWEKISDRVGRKGYTDYVLTDWNSRHAFVRRAGLFREITAHISSSDAATDYLRQLEAGSELYAALITPENGFWADHPDHQNIKNYLECLGLFGIKQPIGLLLASHRQFPAKKFTAILKWVQVFSIRYNVICRLPPNELEKLYNAICQKIAKGGTPADVKEMLLSKYPSDEIFRQSFADKAMSGKNNRARYLLARLAEAEGKTAINEYSLTVEHVLPQNADDHWVGRFGRQWRDYYDRIGNMCLVNKAENKKLAQKPFGKKKAILSESTHSINHNIGEYDDWDAKAIQSRQEKLADLAVRLWRID